HRDRFRYILVDEYQDTNQGQYEWLKLLAEPRRNLCCVGDDDQSIYSWRGAEVANILKFEHDFPGAKVVRLEQNYRSTSHILAAADGLIAHNAGRLGKTLWTDAGEGEKVRVIGVWDGPEEARRVGEEAESRMRSGGRWRASCLTPSSPGSCSTNRVTPRCSRPTVRPKAPGASKTSLSSRARWKNMIRWARSSSTSAWSWTMTRRARAIE